MAEDETSEAPAGKAKGGIMPTVLAVGVLTVLAGGAGALTGTLLASEEAAPVAEAPAAAAPAAPKPEGGAQAEHGGAAPAGEHAAAEGEADEPVPDKLVVMKPIVTNLAAPANMIVRLESSLVISGASEEDTELLLARIEADTTTFLRTVQLPQLEGARGITHLREDLVERARMRSPHVSDVLIQSLVAE
ncbi:flagellar basal body-associated FliL family protein [Antarcticirhabdus aurantiaca]|uniref:Flagellar basal body-associated FliL family protein n=1 Tax=Antarcticirhabdus aurantiaca TaxID=2606717 RepID=A0ACD4NSW7_9HYPH|nr:flagellar basal body-associated FliL family protein [Antarcticirhabdus aurantiaca]WAJ29970.1 flagellar basal body-associated FliL family protein [Jeongeuplla avenae]